MIESGILRVKEDVKLFTNTEPANFCSWIEWCSSFDNIPVDVERDVVFDELPDILTESGACVGLILGVDVTHVLVKPDLHVVVGATSVSFPLIGISPGNSCSVNQVINHAANSREDFAGFRGFQRHT